MNNNVLNIYNNGSIIDYIESKNISKTDMGAC